MASTSSWRRTPLPPNWATLRRARFEHDQWTCVDCGWHDPTGRTLECDHIGDRDDHRLDMLRTRCTTRAKGGNGCHATKTGREAQARQRPRRAPEPHPGG